jgi:hypothetical protein
MFLSMTDLRLQAVLTLHGVALNQFTTSLLTETIPSKLREVLGYVLGTPFGNDDVAVMRVAQVVSHSPIDPCLVCALLMRKSTPATWCFWL